MSNLPDQNIEMTLPQDVARQEFDEIIYHITHDVRASLRALKSLPEWIREELEADRTSLTSGTHDALLMMETHAQRADQLLLDLLTYSRVGRIRGDTGVVALGKAVETAIQTSEIPEDFSVEVDLGVHAVAGVTEEYVLLFMTLLSNAVKHHDMGKGTVTITSTRQGGDLLISVADDGPGIAEQYREKVFGMLETLKSRDDCEGSGLGLPIARKIVDLYQGSVTIADHRPARGTRVEIRLPAHVAVLTAVG
ncbi:MAG: ATP-binding protein [Pseudomonadota bacterium]